MLNIKSFHIAAILLTISALILISCDYYTNYNSSGVYNTDGSSNSGDIYFFYDDNGIETICHYKDQDICTSTAGNFYGYQLKTDTVYLCDSNSHGTCAFDMPVSGVVPPTKCTENFSFDNLANAEIGWEPSENEQIPNNANTPLSTNISSTKSSTFTATIDVNLVDKTQDMNVLPTILIDVQLYINNIVATTQTPLPSKGTPPPTITPPSSVLGNITVTNKITTIKGASISFIIPPNQAINVIYGASSLVLEGHLYVAKRSCSLTTMLDYGTITAILPIAAGWCMWAVSEKDNCPIIP
jgi:hypothetical protein